MTPLCLQITASAETPAGATVATRARSDILLYYVLASDVGSTLLRLISVGVIDSHCSIPAPANPVVITTAVGAINTITRADTESDEYGPHVPNLTAVHGRVPTDG